MGVGPRIASTNGAACTPTSTMNRARPATMRSFMAFPLALDLDDLHGALLEIGLERDRVGRIQRQLVDELAGVEPGYEHQASRRLVAVARLDSRAHAAATRADLDLGAAPHAQRRGIVGMHVADSVGHG